MQRVRVPQRQVLPASDLPPLPELPSSMAELEAVAASAASGGAYSLEQLLEVAARGNPTIRQASLRISAETAKALQAGLYPNPLLMYVGEKINSDGTAGEFQGFELQQRFITANKLELSRLKYRQRAHVAEHLAIAQQLRVSNDVTAHFYSALAARDRLELRAELLKIAEDSAVTARELYNQGQANLADIHRSNADLQRHRLELLAAQNQLSEQLRRLESVLGCPIRIDAVQGSLRPSAAMQPFDVVYCAMIADSPEVLAARAKYLVDQTTVRRESVQWVPDVVVQMGPGYNFTNYDTVVNAKVQLEVPVFDRNQGTIMQAQRDLSRQAQEIRRVELDLRERLAQAYRRYVTALQHATEYERVVIPEQMAAYKALLQNYKENREDWPEVLRVQRDLFDARVTQIDHFETVRVQETMIGGFMLQGGLQAAQSPTPPGHIDAVPKPR